MKIIAHRGLSSRYPENTLLAFRKALEAGKDGIETDLRLSADGEVVLFHDKDLARITGAKGSVETSSLQELKTLDAGEGERIPTLDELLMLVDGKSTLILEIKYNADTYDQLCRIVAQKITGKYEWIEVSCFEDRVLELMHRLDPRIRLHKLIKEAAVFEQEDFDARYVFVSYFDVDVSLYGFLLDKGFMLRYPVILWVVEDGDICEAVNAGLYGIMVNEITPEKWQC